VIRRLEALALLVYKSGRPSYAYQKKLSVAKVILGGELENPLAACSRGACRLLSSNAVNLCELDEQCEEFAPPSCLERQLEGFADREFCSKAIV